MDKLQEFQTIAREGGFVQVEECEAGTVLWLRKEMPDPVTQTHERICIDSAANVVTVYWMTALGKIDSKSFRSALGLKEWFGLQLAKSPPSALAGN